MTSTLAQTTKIQIRAGLSGYVAEINAAFCCASLGITPTVRHADYIGSWLALCSPRHNWSNREVSIM
jgi:antirestriction protein ArdC